MVNGNTSTESDTISEYVRTDHTQLHTNVPLINFIFVVYKWFADISCGLDVFSEHCASTEAKVIR